MNNDFHIFAKAIEARFQEMTKGELYTPGQGDRLCHRQAHQQGFRHHVLRKRTNEHLRNRNPQEVPLPVDQGLLTVEQLWELPLTSTSKFDLDTIAREVNTELKGVTEESFVSVKPDPRKKELEGKLEILKHVIAVKVKEQEDAKNASERAQKRKKLVEALASKEDEALTKMSKDEILKQLAELEDGE